jgi:hypothetical protein
MPQGIIFCAVLGYKVPAPSPEEVGKSPRGAAGNVWGRSDLVEGIHDDPGQELRYSARLYRWIMDLSPFTVIVPSPFTLFRIDPHFFSFAALFAFLYFLHFLCPCIYPCIPVSLYPCILVSLYPCIPSFLTPPPPVSPPVDRGKLNPQGGCTTLPRGAAPANSSNTPTS